MNRPMCLTLVSMLTSVAAAVAAPEVEDPALRETVQLVVVAGALAPSAPVAPARVGKAAVVAPSCGPDAAAPYRQWHHGGLKLAPGCAAALRS